MATTTANQIIRITAAAIFEAAMADDTVEAYESGIAAIEALGDEDTIDDEILFVELTDWVDQMEASRCSLVRGDGMDYTINGWVPSRTEV